MDGRAAIQGVAHVMDERDIVGRLHGDTNDRRVMYNCGSGDGSEGVQVQAVVRWVCARVEERGIAELWTVCRVIVTRAPWLCSRVDNFERSLKTEGS